MTENEMRSYLERHFYASKKIKALEAERTQLRLNAMGGAINYEGNNTATKENATERNLVRLADEENKIDREITLLREKQQEIRRLIASLGDDDLEAVLIYRYILHNTIEETAEALHYAPRTVKLKQNRAVLKLCPLLP